MARAISDTKENRNPQFSEMSLLINTSRKLPLGQYSVTMACFVGSPNVAPTNLHILG